MMVLIHLGRARPRVYGMQAHQTHQPLHPFAVQPVASKVGCHTSRSVDGCPKTLLVNQLHQVEIFGAHRSRTVIGSGTVDAKHLALPAKAHCDLTQHWWTPCYWGAYDSRMFFDAEFKS